LFFFFAEHQLKLQKMRDCISVHISQARVTVTGTAGVKKSCGQRLLGAELSRA